MRFKCIGCEVLARVLYRCAALSPHVVDITLLKKGLHNRPADLRKRLQQEIDASAEGGHDAVVLAYGLCGKGSADLQAKGVPLVIPRAHDCITLFLGSRGRYDQQFQSCPGTYWYSLDYMERDDGSGASLSMGAAGEEDLQAVYQSYVGKYGKDNADYLMEVMGGWRAHYQRAVLIDMGVGDITEVAAVAEGTAARRGWAFERMAGDAILLQRLLAGQWETDFLVLEPGQRIEMACDDGVVAAAPITAPPETCP